MYARELSCRRASRRCAGYRERSVASHSAVPPHIASAVPPRRGISFPDQLLFTPLLPLFAHVCIPARVHLSDPPQPPLRPPPRPPSPPPLHPQAPPPRSWDHPPNHSRSLPDPLQLPHRQDRHHVPVPADLQRENNRPAQPHRKNPNSRGPRVPRPWRVRRELDQGPRDES